MSKKISITINKADWILLCLTIGGILGIITWNMGLL